MKNENSTLTTASTELPRPEADEINLLELLLVLAKHKRMLIVIPTLAFVLACGAALRMPDIYTATTRLLPPSQEKGDLGAMLGNMGGLAALAGVPVGGGSGDLWIGMLQSRTMDDVIIDRFNLMEVYEQDYRSSAYTALHREVKFKSGKKDGILSISVEDKDPQRAAAMANAYVEELRKLNLKFNLDTAGRQRRFLENRLTKVKKDLAQAEEALKNFQETNKAIRIDDQASAIIEAIAKLKGELASNEVELGVLLSSRTEQNPQVKALRESIYGIKGQLAKLEQSTVGQKVAGDIFIATADVPEVGLQYARLMRDFKIQQTLFELLTRQYEIAKIEEAKNTSTIQVLDEAVPADRKTKPKRSLIVVMAVLVAGFVALFLAFVCEYGKRMSEQDRRLWQQIKGHATGKRTAAGDQ